MRAPLVGFVLGWSALSLLAQAPAEPVSITLLAEANTGAEIVQIGQVARLEGGSTPLREAIARLDIAEWTRDGERLLVTREQIRFRLLLQGHNERAFRMAEGPERCLVRRSRGLSEVSIRQAAEGALAGSPGTRWKLARPIVLPTLYAVPGDDIRLEPKVVGRPAGVGRARVEVEILVNNRRRAIVLAEFEAGPSTPTPGLLKLAAHETEPAGDHSVEQPLLVKARDRVKMVANLGTARVMAAGEAQQDGKRGESIRVRNIDSNKIIPGRVVGPGLVEVEY